jgi:hypothetical protein
MGDAALGGTRPPEGERPQGHDSYTNYLHRAADRARRGRNFGLRQRNRPMRNGREPDFPSQVLDFAFSALRETVEFVDRELGDRRPSGSRASTGAGPKRESGSWSSEPPRPPPRGEAGTGRGSGSEEEAVFAWTLAPGRTLRLSVTGGLADDPAELEEILDTAQRLIDLECADLAKARSREKHGAAAEASRRRPGDPRMR